MSPDSLGTENNWALEQINAPFAWGCSTGNPNTQIAVIDYPFDQTEAISNALAPLPTLNGFTLETVRHGTWVTGVIAARGNDSPGITGVMWRAGMVLNDLGATPTLERVSQFISAAAAQHIRIVNLSWGYDWPLRKNDPNWVPNPVDSSTALVYGRLFAASLSATIHGGSMPLVVIAAGDHPVDAFWSLTLALADSSSDHVLVVGGSARANGSVYSQSNRGRRLNIYAPGEDVYTTGTNTPEISVTGTSFSAPLVSGVAGLLLAFDSTLTPVTLRSLILGGATSGHRMLLRAPWIANDSVPILNAYESLRLAAQRPGAPLCGNRVWSVNGQMVAMRDSTVRETLFSTGESGGFLTVMHGGHRIHFLGDSSFSGREFLFDGAHWTETARPDTLPPGIPGGAANSELQGSHDGDSAVVVQAVQNGAVENINVSLEAVATPVTHSLSSWTVPLANSSARMCRAQATGHRHEPVPIRVIPADR